MKSKKATAGEDDIGRDIRLELFRMQLELRLCEKRAYDLFLQNLIKGTSHLSLGQDALPRPSAWRCVRMTTPFAPIAAMLTRWRAAHQ